MKKVAFLLLLFSLWFFSCNQPRKVPPACEKGVIDLSNWDFKKDGNIDLQGDWELYCSHIYSPQDFENDTLLPMDRYCYVPGTWNHLEKDSLYFPGKSFATYRLKVKTKTAEQLLTLKLLDQSSAYRLFVNNTCVAENGRVSSIIESTLAQYHPQLVTFQKPADEFYLTVQISNNLHWKGGLWNRILMGSQETIQSLHENYYLYDLFLLGVMFILFAYHLWIYFLRKSDKTALWFGALCLAIILRSITTSEKFLYILFPDFPPDLGIRIEYISLIVSPCVGSLLYYNLFPKDFSKIAVKWILAFTCIESAIVLFSQVSFFTEQLLWFQCSLLLKAGYIAVATIKAALNKRLGSLPFLISLIIIFFCMVNDILFASQVIQTAFITPYGFFISILSQAYMLASRIAYAFTTVETLSVNLENKVVERTLQLTIEKKKSDDLLLNILPEEIAQELKENGKSKARLYHDVTVLFTDFVNFTGISEKLGPEELVAEIDLCFKAFDAIIEKNGLEKIKTIGDAYLAVCGLPNETPDHAERIVRAAIEIREFMNRPGGLFQIRIGVNSGPVVAGIVGVKKYAYDIWGDTVNTASRMEQNSEAGKINISQSTYEKVKDLFQFEHRGKIQAKNKGEIDMYFLK